MNTEELDDKLVENTEVEIPEPMVEHEIEHMLREFEQNLAYQGLTLEKYMDNVFLGFDAAAEFFKCPEKHVSAGNPVRKNFFTTTKREAA